MNDDNRWGEHKFPNQPEDVSSKAMGMARNISFWLVQGGKTILLKDTIWIARYIDSELSGPKSDHHV